jgi:hypothetical protein
MVTPVDPARGAALNEQELWREMVRWSGGRVVEERGVLLVSGPSPYLRVAIRTDPRVDGEAMVARAGFEMGAHAAWLGASEMGAGLYRRIGFQDLGPPVVELESPT